MTDPSRSPEGTRKPKSTLPSGIPGFDRKGADKIASANGNGGRRARPIVVDDSREGAPSSSSLNSDEGNGNGRREKRLLDD